LFYVEGLLLWKFLSDVLKSYCLPRHVRKTGTGSVKNMDSHSGVELNTKNTVKNMDSHSGVELDRENTVKNMDSQSSVELDRSC
jgi:hypothetical protein